MSLFWTSYYLTHSLAKFHNFQSWAFDLGIYTNTIYQYSIGKPAYSHIINMHMLANNFEPILAVISPIYKIFPTPITLLIIQAIFAGASVFFLYLSIERIFSNKLLNLIIINLYASSIGILYAISYDFHPTLLSVLPLSIIIYAHFFARTKLYWIALLFAILFRQDIPIFIIGLGLYSLYQKRFQQGITTIMFGSTVFLIIQFVIFPHITTNPENAYSGITRFNTSNLDLTKPLSTLNMLIHPEIKLHNSLLLFSQYLFLPLISGFSYLTVIPYLILRYTSSYSNTWHYTVQYNANLEPFLAISTILALKSLAPFIRKTSLTVRNALIILATGLLLAIKLPVIIYFFTLTSSYLAASHQYNYIYDALKVIPKDIPVSAQSEFIAHLANRQELYLFPKIENAQYIVLDHSTQSANWPFDEEKTGMYTEESYQQITRFVTSNPQTWKVIFQQQSITVYQKQTP